MNPMVFTVTVVAAWLTGMFFAWAFVHGAQILRREEAASTAVANQSRVDIPEPDTAEADRLPAAA